MRQLVNLATPIVVGSLLLWVALAGAPRAEGQTKRYVCPPCGLPCDEAVYDHPGTCPKCGMTLIEQGAAEAGLAVKKKVAILVFTGVEIIDFAGPYEVLGAAGFNIYTVAETKDPVTTAMGMTVVPKYSFADAPRPDVLVVPGGSVKAARESSATLRWVADTTAHAQHTMSVCNGAFILASAGLLDGLTATTTATRIDELKAEYPKTKVVYDRRFVDNGKIVTTGGLSAGIDGALHLVATMLGSGTAREVALGEEYDWRPDAGFAPAALAHALIPNVGMGDLGTWKVVRSEGGTDRWEVAVSGTSDLGAGEILDRLGRGLAAEGKWTMTAAPPKTTASELTSGWTFSGREGEPWTGRLTIRAVPEENHRYTALLVIERAGSRTASAR